MDEDYQAAESRIPRWALIAGVVIVFMCLAFLLALFLARTKLLSVAVSVLASDTPTATQTLPPTDTLAPLPTDTEAPTLPPSEIPTETPLPMPPSQILAFTQGGSSFTETFVDNSNNWQGINPTSEVTIQEQKLQLRSSESGKPAVGFCQGENCGPFQDFYYYQSEIVEDRPSTLALGLVFGMNQQKSGFYSFAIRPSSAEFALQKFANGQWQNLIEWTSNPAIKFYPFVNIVGASYQDGNISLFINGSQVGNYTDKQPYKSGWVGFSVESDGVRLLASNVSVYNLAAVTPPPPSLEGAGTQPAVYQSPTPASRFTPTITPQGACPPYVPGGNFVLVVFKTSPSKGDITINGSKYRVQQGNNVFYLPLKKSNVVEIGKKSYEMYYEICKIVNLKLNQ